MARQKLTEEEREKRRAEYAATRAADLEARKAAKAAEREARLRGKPNRCFLRKEEEQEPELPAVPEGQDAEALQVVRQVQEVASVDAQERKKRKVEAFLLDVMENEDAMVRDRLMAAQGLARVLGMDKQEVHVEVSPGHKWLDERAAAAEAVPKPWEPGYKVWRAQRDGLPSPDEE